MNLLKFYSHIVITGSCWLWKGRVDKCGYGRYSRDRLAHRVAYQIAVADLNPPLTIDHLCRRRNCVNPLHLEEVPAGVNTLRGQSQSALNARKLVCKYGHELSGANLKLVKGTKWRICVLCKAARRKRQTMRMKLNKLGRK